MDHMHILYKDFTKRLLENKKPQKTAVFTFGRFNPPTSGHLVNIDKVFSIPGDHFIYVTHSEDDDKNPLSTSFKTKLLKSARPKYSDSFRTSNTKMYSPVQISEHLHENGYDKVIFVIGQDRFNEFKRILKDFDYVEVVSSGKRVDDISGTELRKLAVKNDFEDFSKIMGSDFPKNQIKKAFNAVRKKLITEESELRENYISGNIFNLNSIIESDNNYYQIIDRGTNYVRVVNESGDLKSFFLTNIKEINDASILERFESNKKKNNQLTFKGYSTTNFSKQILEKFNSVLNDDNVYAVLSAIKHTDRFFSGNSLVEQYDHYERSEYYLNQLNCLNEHNYRELMENIIAEKIMKDIPSIKEITRNDKVKTADIILAALGIESKGTPEEKINKAAKDVSKNVSAEMKEIYGSLFQLADDVGITWDKSIFSTNQQRDLGLIESHNFKEYLDSIADKINAFDQIVELYTHEELVAIDEDYNLFELDKNLLVEDAVKERLKTNPLLREKSKTIKIKKPSTKEQIQKKAKCLALKYLKDRKHRNAIHKLTDKERSKLEDILKDKGSVITNISTKLCKKIAKIEKERLQESILESYQEERNSTFENNGKKYTLNKIFNDSEDLPVEEFSIGKLDWVLDYDMARLDELKSELKRVEDSDFNIPILIWKDVSQDKKEQWIIVDGVHRLAKAITKNKKVIKVKKLTDEIMNNALIKQKGLKNDN